MHSDLHAYPWVLEPIAYRDAADLEVKLDTLIVPRAEARIRERALPTPGGHFNLSACCSAKHKSAYALPHSRSPE